jgi:hypothetical protein
MSKSLNREKTKQKDFEKENPDKIFMFSFINREGKEIIMYLDRVMIEPHYLEIEPE